MTKKIISWDLGATKCAVGVVNYDEGSHHFHCEKTYTTKIHSHVSLDNLIEELESGLDLSMTEADAICVGAAGHYDGEILQHANGYPYLMNFADIASKRCWPKFDVIHDYASVVCATFTSYMNSANIHRLNDSPLQRFGRRVALGVGTGLGLKDGVLFENGAFWLGQNEMGHLGITAPAIKDPLLQKRHSELIRFLLSEKCLKEHEPLNFERILTGTGLVNLFRFCYPSSDSTLTPEELAVKIYKGQANDVISLFSWYLGLFVSVVQLTFMPEAGVWLTGGVILNHSQTLDMNAFHQGIEAIPSYLSIRKKFPLGILHSHEHAFIGGAYYSSKRLMLTNRNINQTILTSFEQL